MNNVIESVAFKMENGVLKDDFSPSNEQNSVGEVVLIAKEASAPDGNEADSSSSNHSGTEGENDHVDVLSACHSDSEPSVGKDSIVQCSPKIENDFPPPEESLVEKIIKQVEYYFSDVNIIKDTFLLKHVRRNKEGYVSLKLIASFRKVKSLTKNWKIVSYSLKQSNKLQINVEGTKIRRKDPLPDLDDTSQARTLVAFNFPTDSLTVESVSEIFSKFGMIVAIKILQAGANIPQGAKRCLSNYPEAASGVSALVEFEKHEAASQAATEIGESTSSSNSMKVIPLTFNSVKKDRVPPKVQGGGKSEKVGSNHSKKVTPRKRLDRLEQVRFSEVDSTSCSENELSPLVRRRANEQSEDAVAFEQSRRLSRAPKVSAFPTKVYDKQKRFRSKVPTSSEGDGAVGSPWVQRRQLAARDGGGAANNSRLLVPEGVVRLPKGPDGTNGFHWNRMAAVMFDGCKSSVLIH